MAEIQLESIAMHILMVYQIQHVLSMKPRISIENAQIWTSARTVKDLHQLLIKMDKKTAGL